MINNTKTLNRKVNEVVSLCAWCSVLVTLFTLIGVMLNLSSIVYLRFFDTYHPLQFIVFITMIMWAIKFFLSEDRKEKFVYTSICMGIALSSLFFMMMQIY